MKTSHLPTALAGLADALGVQASYRDAFGETSGPSEASLVKIIRALGVDIDGVDDAAGALAALKAESASELAPPVIVVWDGAPTPVTLQVQRTAGAARGAVRCALELEDGSTAALATSRNDTEVLVPGGLAQGYHRLVVEQGERRVESLLISAPSHAARPAHLKRAWGVFAPTYAIRSQQDWGAGDLRGLGDLARQVHSHGGELVGSTPLLPGFLDELFEPSPYSPVSRLAWNELYLDLASIDELRSGPAATLLQDSSVSIERERLRELDLIDYRSVAALRRRVLDAGLASLEPGSARDQQLDAWLALHPRIADYARFRAETERRAVPWQRWPAGARSGTIRAANGADPMLVRYHEWVQWLLDGQLGELSDSPDAAGLYLDMPVGTHVSGYDSWRFQDQFATGVAVGAPPDLLGPDGQNWALPPLVPARQRAAGHDYLIECTRHLFTHADAVRIDHVMGLHRLFWIPDGMPASEGAYVTCPQEELWAITCLESARAGVLVVGEDLGTVPPETRTAMQAHGASRSYVLQFQAADSPAGTLELPTSEMLATLDTHDSVTIAAWWGALAGPERATVLAVLQGRELLPLETADAVDDIDATTIANALLHLLAGSDAQVVIATLEDLWGELDPQNIPGTTGDQHPNWRRRCAMSLEELADAPAQQAALRRTGELRGRVRISGDDLHLFGEGTHARLYERLGAHLHTDADGVQGVAFAVWAPNAERVSVIGDCNGWTPGEAQLEPRGGSGVWETFMPGARDGARYKFHIESRWNGYVVDKADPFAAQSEQPPKTASIVRAPSTYDWGDEGWMRERAAHNALDAPMSIYELHLGSWMRITDEEGEGKSRPMTYRELAPTLVEHVVDLGFTHVEFMPLTEHPFAGSWGYQVTGFFAPTSRFGDPDDLRFLIDQLHQAGIAVILDWVPSHFPTDEHGLGFFDGTHLFEHGDPRQGFHPDWKTLIFNLERSEVRSFLLSSAMFWLRELHVDALRVDAVASMLYLDYSRNEGEWIPNEHGGRENLAAMSFLRMLNERVYGELDGVQVIAEESTAWSGVSRPTSMGGLGFGLKWDMGWMHDTLQFFGRDPIHRQFHQQELTFRALYAPSENFLLPLSHDEVVHGKGSIIARMPGDSWQQFANLRLLYSYMFALPGKKLLFMGCELGQRAEWDHDSSIDWHLLEHAEHRGIMNAVRDLNAVYRSEAALHELDCDHEAGFSWAADDAGAGVLAFVRFARDRAEARPVLAAFSLTPSVHEGFRVGVPCGGRWSELFNSDTKAYGGSGAGNPGAGIEAEQVPWNGHEWSLELTMPPLGAVLLAPEDNSRVGGKPT